MPHVAVTIAGRVYRMACGEGEEAHLHDLAQTLDGRIGTMRGQFGEIGDQRITIMAAITLVDDLSDAQKRIAILEAALADARHQRDGSLDAVAAALDEAASRIDEVARTLTEGG